MESWFDIRKRIWSAPAVFYDPAHEDRLREYSSIMAEAADAIRIVAAFIFAALFEANDEDQS